MNMQTLVLRILSIPIGAAILFFCFILGVVMTMEGYNILDPYVDTEFAPKYTPKKFATIHEGMTAREVEKIIGRPLNSYLDTLRYTVILKYDYTNDGKLRRRSDKKHMMVGDMAWYRSSVYFNEDSIVTDTNYGWSYD